MTARQLILDLARDPSFDADEFLVSPSNAMAYDTIQRWPDWPRRSLLLVAPAGAGKSHLGAIWAERSGAVVVRNGAAIEPDHWAGPVVALVEDCDRTACPEAALFHLLNMVEESQGWLVLTARTPPDLWGVRTPDLLSRLRLATPVPIGAPDTPLIRAVIVKLFADRQILIDEDVVAYAARHCDQELEAVSAFVAAVDEAALAAGRRITRPLAAKTLAQLTKQQPAFDD